MVPSPQLNDELSKLLHEGKCIEHIFTPKGEHKIVGKFATQNWVLGGENSIENLDWNLALRGVIGLKNSLPSPER